MSNVRSKPLDDKPAARLNYNRMAAILAWLGGVYLTYLFVFAAAPGLGWVGAFIVSALTQAVLTLAERPLWRRLARKPGAKLVPLAIVVTVFDGLLNAAGMYPYMGQAAKTGLGIMAADFLQVQPTLTTRTAVILAIILGVVFAGVPEMLWEYGDD